MIIFNQRKYVQDILISHEKPNNMSVNGLIVYLCKYFYDNCKDLTQSQYVNQIRNILRSFNFKDGEYEEYRYINTIDSVIKKIKSGKIPNYLPENTEINVTKSEWAIISSCQDERQMKLLFTLYILAKTYPNPTGWINYSETDIFKLANITCGVNERMALLRSLYLDNKIQFNHKIDRSGYKVELGEDVNDIELTVTRFEHLGNQCLAHYRTGYIVCEDCGRLVKRHSNRQILCKSCAKKRQIQAQIIAHKDDNNVNN